MFKSLMEKRHAESQIDLEEGVQVPVWGLNRAVLMGVGAVLLLSGLLAGEKVYVNYCIASLGLRNL